MKEVWAMMPVSLQRETASRTCSLVILFLDQLEQLGISRLHTETDAVASRFLHQFQGFAIHRIDPRKGAPVKPEPPTKDLATDLLHSAAVGNKEIVGHIDPVYPVSEYLLDLIDDARRRIEGERDYPPSVAPGRRCRNRDSRGS